MITILFVFYVARCNIDIQFVNEASSPVCDYICKYQTKAEKTGLNIKFAKSSKSTSSTLWSLALSGMQDRDVGSIEAADSLLGHWQTKTDPSTHIKWVDTSENKNRMLKKRKDLLKAEKSTDIYTIDTVTDRYPNRSDELELWQKIGPQPTKNPCLLVVQTLINGLIAKMCMPLTWQGV